MVQHDDQEYLTPEEASAILGVSRRTLERFVKNKTITRYHKGFRVLFKRTEVEALAIQRESVDKDR